jgi:HAE1 family hydrophobic/amphiphilic exporter-1
VIFGERKYAMRVWLDPAKLAERSLTATDVVNALTEQNVEVPAGQLGQPPSDDRSRPSRCRARRGPPQRSRGSSTTSSSRTRPTAWCCSKMWATPDRGRRGLQQQPQIQGYTAVGIGVQQLSNANALDVDRNAKAMLKELSKSFPPGLEYAIAFDSTTIVGDSIREVLVTLAKPSSSSSWSSSSSCSTGAPPSFPPSPFRFR